MNATKQCSKCGEVKTTTEFNKKSASRDGLQSQCKHCVKIYFQSNQNEIAEQQKQYQKLRRQVDAQFKLIGNLRNRLNQCIKNKTQTTKELIGIPFEIFMNWSGFSDESSRHQCTLTMGQ